MSRSRRAKARCSAITFRGLGRERRVRFTLLRSNTRWGIWRQTMFMRGCGRLQGVGCHAAIFRRFHQDRQSERPESAELPAANCGGPVEVMHVDVYSEAEPDTTSAGISCWIGCLS